MVELFQKSLLQICLGLFCDMKNAATVAQKKTCVVLLPTLFCIPETQPQ